VSLYRSTRVHLAIDNDENSKENKRNSQLTDAATASRQEQELKSKA
jgi:hypothetical protein